MAILAVRYAIPAARAHGALPDWLEIIPGTGLSWIYFIIAMVVLFHARRAGESWSAAGLARPSSPLLTIGLALAGVVAAIVLDSLSQPFLTSAFGTGQDLSSFREMVGNPGRLALMLVVAWIFAAFGEEVFFRGWLMARLDLLAGGRPRSAGLLLQAAFFGAAHAYQGPVGMISTGLYGLVYGALVRRSSGNLWAAVLAHGLLDTVGLTAIYAGALPVG